MLLCLVLETLSVSLIVLVQIKANNATDPNDTVTSAVENLQSKFVEAAALMQDKINTMTDAILQMSYIVHKYIYTVQPSLRRPKSCVDVHKYDHESGIHTLFLSKNRNVKVYCDQMTDDGGWTVIQRRQDGSVDFYRNWSEYEQGFGNLSTEFWIGLTNLHYLTEDKNVTLRVDIMDFDGSTSYAIYKVFSISDAHDNYRLNVGGYNGTAGDGLDYNNKMQFSTYDRDHDLNMGNCAKGWQSGYWFAHRCTWSNPNGRYLLNSYRVSHGMTWVPWKSNFRSFKRIEMKIKQ